MKKKVNSIIKSERALIIAVVVLILIILLVIFLPTKESGNNTEDPTIVQNVVLGDETISLTVGSSYKLVAVVSPSTATNKNVSYMSLNSSIAIVDQSGKVTAKAVGKTTIVAMTANGKKDECIVNVVAKSVPVTSILITQSDLTLSVGESVSLKTKVSPSNTTEHSYKWTSSNTSVATVSSSGVVTAKKIGSALITVTTSNNKVAICDIEVKAKAVAVTSIKLSAASKTVYVGESFSLTATLNPSNASNKKVTWTSSNTNVAMVDASGKVVTKGAGTATITAKSSNGKTATCTVKVNTKSSGSTYVLPEQYKVPSKYTTTSYNYSSSTLKFKTIKLNNTTTHYSLIWVKDANMQINSANNNHSGGTREALLNNEINTYGYKAKGMIAVNGGFTWNGRSNIPILVSRGVITKNNVYQTWRSNNGAHNSIMYKTLGVKKDGTLINISVDRSYLINYGTNNEKLSDSGYKLVENWVKKNGVRNTWAITHFQSANWVSSNDQADLRTSICQVDEHNFVLAVGSSSISGRAKDMHDLFGCKIVVNLDGGGSTGMYYKTKSSSSISKIYQYNRPDETGRRVGDMLYFVEQ